MISSQNRIRLEKIPKTIKLMHSKPCGAGLLPIRRFSFHPKIVTCAVCSGGWVGGGCIILARTGICKERDTHFLKSLLLEQIIDSGKQLLKDYSMGGKNDPLPSSHAPRCPVPRLFFFFFKEALLVAGRISVQAFAHTSNLILKWPKTFTYEKRMKPFQHFCSERITP